MLSLSFCHFLAMCKVMSGPTVVREVGLSHLHNVVQIGAGENGKGAEHALDPFPLKQPYTRRSSAPPP